MQDKKERDVLEVTAARGNEKHLEKLRYLSSLEEWQDKVRLLKHKEHFIFTVQSVGVQPPDVLFTKAIDELSDKCDRLLSQI